MLVQVSETDREALRLSAHSCMCSPLCCCAVACSLCISAINGPPACVHPYLQEVLRDEWASTVS